jgi:iron(III) transport system permease protein
MNSTAVLQLPARSKGRIGAGRALTIAFILVCAFVAYPLLSVLGVFELEEVKNVFSPTNAEPITNSLLLAVFTIVPSTGIGVMLAWLCSRTDMPGRNLITGLVSISFVVPVLLTSIAYIFMFGKNSGLINRLFMGLIDGPIYNVYSFSGVVLLSVLHTYPLVFFTTIGGLSRMSPELEEAGQISGLTPVGVFFKITVRAILPSIMAGVTFVVAESLTVLAAPLLLGAPIQLRFMTTELFGTLVVGSNLAAAIALSLPLVSITLATIALQVRLLGGNGSARYAVVSGKGMRSETVALKRWKWPLTLVAWLPVVLSLILPVVTLLAAALMDRWWKGLTLANFSLRNFEFLASDSSTLLAVGNSVLLASGVAIAMAFSGALLAILLAGERTPLKKVIRALVAVPLGLPHVVVAVLILLAWYGTPFRLGGSIWILALGYVFIMLPYALRTCDAARGQIDNSLAEAASIAGMGSLQTVIHVMFPLMKGGVVTTFVIVFLFTIKEFSMTALVYGADTITLPVLVYTLLEGGSYERTAAASMLLLLLTVLGLVLASKVFRISLNNLKA